LRRNEWLLGRIVAKDAVRQWAKQHFALELAPVDIQILSTSLGKPVVQVPELANLTPLPDISISHSQNFYVAVVSSVGLQVGIDIQKLNAVRSDDWLDVAFSSLELATLTQLLPKNPNLLMGAWCAKEAAAKAAGIGLQGNPHQWQITSYNLLSQEITISYAQEYFISKMYFGKEEIVAICQK